jgi:hypothetical protein
MRTALDLGSVKLQAPTRSSRLFLIPSCFFSCGLGRLTEMQAGTSSIAPLQGIVVQWFQKLEDAIACSALDPKSFDSSPEWLHLHLRFLEACPVQVFTSAPAVRQKLRDVRTPRSRDGFL